MYNMVGLGTPDKIHRVSNTVYVSDSSSKYVYQLFGGTMNGSYAVVTSFGSGDTTTSITTLSDMAITQDKKIIYIANGRKLTVIRI